MLNVTLPPPLTLAFPAGSILPRPVVDVIIWNILLLSTVGVVTVGVCCVVDEPELFELVYFFVFSNSALRVWSLVIN